MRLRHWVCGPLDNNIYLLEDEAAGRCVLFDPGIDIGPVFQHIDDNGLEVERILLTAWPRPSGATTARSTCIRMTRRCARAS